MKNLLIGKGNLDGKAVFANCNFKKGEIVVKYSLRPISDEEYKKLSKKERQFTHVQHGVRNLYSAPERYVNHSETPNTYQDFKISADVALRDIAKGEEITTDATKDDI